MVKTLAVDPAGLSRQTFPVIFCGIFSVTQRDLFDLSHTGVFLGVLAERAPEAKIQALLFLLKTSLLSKTPLSKPEARPLWTWHLERRALRTCPERHVFAARTPDPKVSWRSLWTVIDP